MKLAFTLLLCWTSTLCYSQQSRLDRQLDSVRALINKPLSGNSQLDEKYGFRDLKFETPVAQIKGLVSLGKQYHGEQTFIRPTDSKRIGQSTLASIHYVFYKGKLSAVVIKTKGYTNSRGVLEAFTNLYGKPYQSNEYIEAYNWFGSKAMVSYDQNSITDDATTYMFSKAIAEKQKEDEENVAKKAASDL